MRAELAGKLSMSSPTAQHRLEDTLTDGVFSGLRYLPREVLARWLRSVLPSSALDHATDVAVEGAQFEFWPSLPGGSEPDLMITVGALLVIVEAKYQSNFGQGWGLHQLSAEWVHGHQLAKRRGLEGPIVVAITSNLVEPGDIASARSQLPTAGLDTALLEPKDAVVWCPWQSVAKAVAACDSTEWRVGERAIAHDVFDLMASRGVRYVYEGFKTADWWLLAAAADAATDRVYPMVAQFAKELVAHGAERGLVWGGADAGVVWYESKHPSYTNLWHRDYIQLPMLHSGFGRRTANYCALYVLFSFNDPAIRAGWWFQPRPVGGFTTRVDGVVEWMQGLDESFDIVDSTDWRWRPTAEDRSLVTPSWMLDRLANKAWFRVERSWPPDAVKTTAPVIDVLADLSESLLAHGVVLDGLEADGTLDRSQAPAVVQLAVDTVPEAEDGGGSSDEP